MASNDVTGDSLFVGAGSTAYEAGHELAFGKKDISRIDVIGSNGSDGLGYGADQYLGDLPEDHPNRNWPLAELGAEYRLVGTKAWCAVTPAFGISKVTYNKLGLVWTKDHQWRATK